MSTTLLTLFFAHWMGDFVLQSDFMARNKSKRWDVLFGHVCIYTATLCAFASVAIKTPGSINMTLFAASNFVAHFVTDAITSRMASRLYAGNKVHWFFVVIGLDQFIHAATLIYTIPILIHA
jgi:hypothetical protein